MYRHFVVSFVCLFLWAAADSTPIGAQNVKEPATGAEFVSQGSNYGHNFTLTHVGARSKLGFKVYGAAAYFETGKYDKSKSAASQMLKDGPAKLIVMHFVRSVDVGKIREQYQEGFEKNISDYANIAKKDGDGFLGAMSAMNPGDRMEVCWTAGGSVTLVVKGQVKYRCQNRAFAVGLWSIWFGNSPVLKWTAQ